MVGIANMTLIGIVRMAMYYNRPLYRNSMALMLNTAMASIFNFLFWMIAGRTVSAESIGLATAAISAAAMLVTLSRFGLDAGIVRYFPRYVDKSGFYNATILIILLVTFLMTGIFLAGLDILSPAMLFLKEQKFVILFIGYILITAVCNIQGTAFVAVRRADLSLLQSSVLAISIPLLWTLSSLGILGIIISIDIGYLAMLILGVIMLYMLKVSSKPLINIKEVRESLGFSVGNYFAAIFTAAPIALAPIIIVNTVGAKWGAYFYIAYSIATFMFMVPDAISMSLFVEGSHRQPLKANAIKSIKLATLIMVPGILFIIFFGNNLLALFGRQYSIEALPMLQLLAMSSLPFAIILIYTAVKRVQEDIPMVNFLSFAPSAITLGLGYLFLIMFGLNGLGYAWLISNVTICAIALGMMLFLEKWAE
jgi:O-antigen/teichoic acid export membrane protein